MTLRQTLTASTLLVMLLSSCSQNTEPQVVLSDVPFVRESIIDTGLIVVQKNADLCDWRSEYTSTVALFERNGLVELTHYRGLEDTNLIVSIYGVEEYDLAKALTSSEEKLSTLYDLAVDDGLDFHFLDHSLAYTAKSTDSIFHLMSFKTMKYDRWEQAFLDDYLVDPKEELAVTNVFRHLDNSDHVYMLFRVNDPSYVEKMEKNNAFRMKMLGSGVISYPETYKLTEYVL